MDDGDGAQAVRLARVEERMNTKHAQYETGLQRQEARTAERDAKIDAKLEEFATKMAERDVKMAERIAKMAVHDAKMAEHIAKIEERDTANTRWIVGTIAVTALLIVAVLGLLMRWPGPIP